MTLIEILIAMVILTLGATSLIALFASASANHKLAVDRTHAALVAEEIFSEVQARYFADVEAKDMLAALSKSLPERIHGYFWEIRLFRPFDADRAAGGSEEVESAWAPGELVVRVAVRWSLANDSREEVYSTILLPRPR